MTELIGREPELARLRQVVQSTASGHGALVLVTGEAGIGKTRLIEEAVSLAGQRDLAVVSTACWEGGGPPAFWPWVSLLRALGDDDAASALLDGADRHAVAGDPDGARFALFDRITRSLLKIAADRPAVVVIDDLHWADTASILLLRFLAPSLSAAPLTVVSGYRIDELEPEQHLALQRSGVRLDLQGLTARDVALLADALGTPVDAVDLHRRTDGNPLFVSELVRLAGPSGSLAGIPDSVRAVISRRLGRLSPACRETLETAALIGMAGDVTTLASALPTEPVAVLDALDEAEQARLVAGRWQFTHPLVRDALALGVGGRRRAEIHGRIGEVLEDLAGPTAVEERAAELAHHFGEAAALGATERARAMSFSRLAGDRATAVLAYEEAAAHYETALEHGPDDTTRGELLLDAGDARLRAGDMAEARSRFDAAADLARRAARPELLAAAALGFGAGLGGFEVKLFDRHQIHLLEEALAALPDDDTSLRARVLARLSLALSFLTTVERREQLSAEAVAMARRLGDRGVLASTLGAHLDLIAGPADAEQRLAEATEMLAAATAARDRELELLARRFRVVAYLERRDIPAVHAEVAAYGALAGAMGVPLYQWYVPLWRAMLALLAGRTDEVEPLLEAVREVGVRAGSTNAAVLAFVLELSFLEQTGRGAEADLEMIAATDPDVFDGPNAQPTRARLAADAGNLDEARARLAALSQDRFAALPIDAEWLVAVHELADACAVVADHDQADVLYDLLLPHADRFAVDGIGAACRGSTHRPLARLAALQGRTADADAHFAAALAAHQAAGAPLLAARTRAERDAAGIEAIEGKTGPSSAADRSPSTLVARFRRVGDVWELCWEEASVMVKDAKGLRDIAELLRRPDRELAALELVGTAAEADHTAGGEAIDRTAMEAYRRRITDLQDDIDEAEANNDPGRAERAHTELDALVAELSRSVGLGGRARRAPDATERARKAVGTRIGLSIGRIERELPGMGRHLRNSIRTGAFCRYRPERPVDWEL